MKAQLSGTATILLVFWGQVVLAGAVVDQAYMPPEARSYANVGVGDNVAMAQTFTVGVAGILTGFDVWVERQPDASLPLLFDIRRTTVDGVPTEEDTGANILVSGSLDPVLVPIHREPTSPPAILAGTTYELRDGGTLGDNEGVALPIDSIVSHPPMTSPIHVELTDYRPHVMDGEVLALVLRSFEPAGFGGLSYVWRGDGPGGYAGGQQFGRSTGSIPTTWFNFGVILDGDGDLAFRTYVSRIPEPSSIVLSTMSIAGLLTHRGARCASPSRRRKRNSR